MSGLKLAWQLARRELRGGLKGFRIFFLCIALGTAAIAAVESVSDAFLTGIKDQGQTLLGGDVSVELVHRPATQGELAFLRSQGKVAHIISMRTMAYALRDAKPAERELADLKAVDANWPLFGTPGFTPQVKTSDAIACEADGICGAAAEQTLLDRLHAGRGDLIRIGDATLRIIAVLNSEPDRVAGGFSLGPRLLVSDQVLPQTGLIREGSLINYVYRVALRPGLTIDSFKAAAGQAFPDAGWQIRDRNDAAPGLRRFVEQVSMFLTLVGLTALGIGGVGAAQSVSAFLDKKRFDIAILKSLGADGQLVFLAFFLQVMAIGAGALLLGMVVGASAPFVIAVLFAGRLPLPPTLAIFPGPLLLAAGFGLLSAIAFSVPPLSRARAIPPASLLRDTVEPARVRLDRKSLMVSAGAALLVAALTLAFAPSRLYAGEFLAGAALLLGLLRLIAAGLRRLALRLPRPRSTLMRLALGNLTRPGAATAGVVTALGLGLTLLATVTLLDRIIGAEVTEALPGRAPSFFFVDIQPDQAQAFDRTIQSARSAQDYRRTPMIRGRITAINGVPAAKVRIGRDVRWVLNGDRGITYAATPPPGTHITAGSWWPAGYQGPTLVSLDQAVADGARLKLGDTMRLNVLGREFDAKIASFRKVDFTNGGQNFVLVLSPGLIDKAPHSFLATVRVDPKDENALYTAVTDRFPNVSTVRVKDAIAQVGQLIEQLGQGIRAASLITILAGLLVLAGTIAAGARARLYDATVLKVVGATRWQLVLVYAAEYGLLGMVTGVVALLAGTAAAFVIARQILDVPFLFDLKAMLLTIAGGGAATVLFGLGGALGALRARPAATLKSGA